MGGARINISCDGTDGIDSRHAGADGKAVGHVAVKVAHDAAVSIDGGEAVSHGEGGGTDAAPDGTAIITLSYHTAVIVGIIGNGMDGDITAYAAVLHNATITGVLRNISRNAADILLTGDAGIGQDDVPDGGTTGHTKETLVAVCIGDAAFIDADAADGMALTVEGAAEVSIAIVNTSAYGGVVVLHAGGIVPVGGVGVADVITQHEVRVAEVVGGVAVGAVDVLGQQVEAGGGGDDVGLLGRASVIACSDIPDVSQCGVDCHILCRHGEDVAADGTGAGGVSFKDKAGRCCYAEADISAGGSVEHAAVAEDAAVALDAAVRVGLVGTAGVSQGDTGAGAHGVGVALEGGITYGAAVVTGVGLGGRNVNTSCDGTVVLNSRHAGTDGKAVGHVTVKIAHDAAVTIDDGEAVSHGEGGGTDAAADGTAITVAYHTAVIVGIVGNGMDGDVTAYAAVLHNAAITAVYFIISRDAADILLTGDAGIGQDDVPDGGTTGHTKETLVAVCIGDAAFIDADAADGMALTVEGAAEVSIAIVNTSAYGGVVVLHAGGIVPVGGVGVADVITQHEVRVAEVVGGVAVGAVHVLGQQVEAGGGGDDVRVTTTAASRPNLRPLGVEVNGAAVGGGEVLDALAVGVGGAAAVSRRVPSGKGVAGAGEGVGGEGLGGVVGEVLVGHGARGGIVVLVEAYGVGGPDEGVVRAGAGVGGEDTRAVSHDGGGAGGGVVLVSQAIVRTLCERRAVPGDGGRGFDCGVADGVLAIEAGDDGAGDGDGGVVAHLNLREEDAIGEGVRERLRHVPVVAFRHAALAHGIAVGIKPDDVAVGIQEAYAVDVVRRANGERGAAPSANGTIAIDELFGGVAQLEGGAAREAEGDLGGGVVRPVDLAGR